jgi:hypothetical protein
LYLNFIFKVIASAGEETHSDIHSGEESSGSSNDYTEKRSLAITIPDYSLLEVNDEKFYVSIYIHTELNSFNAGGKQRLFIIVI